MKGTTYQFNRTSEKDPLTGVEVIRITDNKAIYDRPYFNTPQFSRDGRTTIFVSDFTGTSIVKNPDAPAIGKIGFGELFALDLESGKAIQVTQSEAIKMGHGAHAMLAPDGKKAYYYSNEYVKEVDLETLESRELMYVPITYNFHSLTITDDGRYLAFTLVEEVKLLTEQFTNPLSGTAPGSRERFFKEPSSLLIRYDLAKNKGEVIFGGHYRITHTNIKPDDGNMLLYCHDGPWHLVQRMWTVNALTDEVNPLIVQQKYLERIGHEFVTPSGRIGTQYSFRYKTDMPFFMFADIYLDFDGKNQERYYYKYERPEHVNVNLDETLAVGDRAMLNADMFEESKRYLALITYDRENHSARSSILCAHDSSGKKHAHVHPVFTPDCQHILFSSDKDGSLNIYMVAADYDKTIKSR